MLPEEDHNQEIVMLIRITKVLEDKLIHQDEEGVVQEDEELVEVAEAEVVGFSKQNFKEFIIKFDRFSAPAQNPKSKEQLDKELEQYMTNTSQTQMEM